MNAPIDDVNMEFFEEVFRRRLLEIRCFTLVLIVAVGAVAEIGGNRRGGEQHDREGPAAPRVPPAELLRFAAECLDLLVIDVVVVRGAVGLVGHPQAAR